LKTFLIVSVRSYDKYFNSIVYDIFIGQMVSSSSIVDRLYNIMKSSSTQIQNYGCIDLKLHINLWPVWWNYIKYYICRKMEDKICKNSKQDLEVYIKDWANQDIIGSR